MTGHLTVMSLKTWTVKTKGRADPKTERETQQRQHADVHAVNVLAAEFIVYSRERLNPRKSLFFAFHLVSSEQEWN